MTQDTIYVAMYVIGTPILLVMLVRSFLRDRAHRSPRPPAPRRTVSDEWVAPDRNHGPNWRN
jgi:hypothetical protein